MDSAARGKKLLEESKYEEAIAEYTAALKVSPASPDYYIQRSIANVRAKNNIAALSDASNGVLNAQKRAKRELIIEGQFRRGVASYNLERYGDAEFLFGVVKRMNEKHKMVDMWTQKTKKALEKLDAGDEKGVCTAKETPDFEDVVMAENGASKPPTNGSSSVAGVVSAPPTAPQQTAPDKIRHEWYQNTEHVYFTLLAKGVPKEQTQVDIMQRSLSLSFPLATGASYDLTIDPLFGPVKPEKCISRVMPTKIEIILAKATPGQKWHALESDEPADATKVGAEESKEDEVKRAVFTDTAPRGPAYPTSSKSGPKDWDKITKDLRTADGDGKSKFADDDDDDAGGDEANAFFKKLFKNATPETQRAMMKSYTESNGTALSTNWEEVSKGPVPTEPPDGMEAKKW